MSTNAWVDTAVWVSAVLQAAPLGCHCHTPGLGSLDLSLRPST